MQMPNPCITLIDEFHEFVRSSAAHLNVFVGGYRATGLRNGPGFKCGPSLLWSIIAGEPLRGRCVDGLLLRI